MPVNSVNAADSTSAISSTVSQATGNQQLDQQAFLKLLVTQLTNQDPLNPQDQSAFLAQLAQFSTVEGVNNMSTGQNRLQASSMLGKTVDAMVTTNNTPQIVSGKVLAVSWDTSGIHLSLEGQTDSITLDQVQQVRN